MARVEGRVGGEAVNRVADAVLVYAEQEVPYLASRSVADHDDREATALKKQYYGDVYRAYRKKPNAAEKRSLRFVRSEIRKLNAKLHPTLLRTILYSSFVNRIREYFNKKRPWYAALKEGIERIQKEGIREQNYHHLSEQLKKAGFSFQMEGVLKKMIAQDLPRFHVRYADIENRNAHFVLHFQKIPRTNTYYFQKFDAAARPGLDALLKKDDSLLHYSFPLPGDVRFSAKEAANLVNGRSVCRSIEGEESWWTLQHAANRETKLTATSFQLEDALQSLPIAERHQPRQFQTLVNALKGGAEKEVTLSLPEGPVKCKLSADASHKTLRATDGHGQSLDLSALGSASKMQVAKRIVRQSMEETKVVTLSRSMRG